jgi:preprotein translocase subunit SecD
MRLFAIPMNHEPATMPPAPDSGSRPPMRATTPSFVVVVIAVLLAVGGIAIVACALPALSPGASAAASPATATMLEYDAIAPAGASVTTEDLEAIAETLRRRLESLDVVGATVSTVPPSGIAVELPLVGGEADAVRRVLGSTGVVEFVPLGDHPMNVGDAIDPQRFPPLMDGAQVADVTAGTDQSGGRTLDITLKPAAARFFADYTTSHVGEYLAITLDGTAVSVPLIMSEIPDGRIQIESGGIGGFDPAELRALMALLRGQLDLPLQERAVEPGPS